MASVPNLADEIDRKAAETIRQMLMRYERSELSLREFRFGIRTIWDAVAGLVSPEISKALMDLSEGAMPESVEVRLWNDGGRLCALRYWRGSHTIDIVDHNGTVMRKAFDPKEYTDPAIEAQHYLQRFVELIQQRAGEI